MVEYEDGTLIKWGTSCARCLDIIHAGDRAFLSEDGVETICFKCAEEEENENADIQGEMGRSEESAD